MQTVRKWVKTDNSKYTLWDNNLQIGTMEIATGTLSNKATAQFGNQNLIISKTGFWKSHIEIMEPNGQIIAKVYPEKWYANTLILEYENKKYKLLLKNNPLAEWALQDNNENVLSYGLSTQEGKPCIRITDETVNPNYLFDFILWYLFVPIASEQSSDDLTFLLLIA